MRPLWFAFRHCLSWAAPATVLAIAVLWIGFAATGLATPWLHLAAFLPTTVAGLAAIAFWPVFATDRSLGELVRRLTRRPLHGMPTAALGAILAAACCLAVVAFAASPMVPLPRAHHRLAPPDRPLLDDDRTELTFLLPPDSRELQLRPIALLPNASPEATRLVVLVDGIACSDPVTIYGDRQLVRIPLSSGSARTVSLRRTAGNLPLWFDERSVVAIDGSPIDRTLACALAMAVYLLPLFVTLSIAMATARFVRLPMALVGAAIAMLLQSLGQLGPATDAIGLCARGRWLPTEPIFWRCVTSLGAGVAAMIAAMPLRAEPRR